MNNAQPKVSCLMVTANRADLAKRAVTCFTNQTYKNKELVIVDDGQEDYTSIIDHLPADQVQYVKIESSSGFKLGKLRNISLEHASGEFLVKWDDDDWYHHKRIEIQANCLNDGYDACCLSAALMHLNTPTFINNPYIGHLKDGIPGSIMHRRNDSIRYPETRKAEDTEYLSEWKRLRYKKLPDEWNHLFLRAYHGDNTWEVDHFERRIKNSTSSAIQYFWYKFFLGDVLKHPKFILCPPQKKAFDEYYKLSEELGLL